MSADALVLGGQGPGSRTLGGHALSAPGLSGHASNAPALSDRALSGRAAGEKPDLGQMGEIFCAWRVAPDALMLLGWQCERPALEGIATLQRAGAQRGRFTRIAWPITAGPGEAYRFLAVVQAPGSEAQDGDTLLLQGRRGTGDAVLARLPPAFLEAAEFGAELARVAPGSAAAPAAGFLIDMFTPAAMSTNAAIRTMMLSFLGHVSTPDGCVEVLGGVREQCAFLQGWGRSLGPAAEIIVSGATLQRHPAREAAFQRPDIVGPSSGHILVLPAAAAQSGAVETLFLLGREGIRHRPVLSTCRVLSEPETIGHIRDVLPSLRCDSDTHAVLLAALRPRYEGRFTLFDAGHPIRFNIDLAVAGADAGAYLTGWMYDPAGVVDSVRFCRASGAGVRLDERWTRIPRPDVTDGFCKDPVLPPGDPARHDHGFAVHVPPEAATGDGAHVEIVFRDGWCGFVPVPLAPVRTEAGRLRLLASVDLHKPSGVSVIERQLAPFFLRLADSAGSPAVPPLPAHWSSVTVVPLPVAEPPRALLAHLLRDPLAGHEGLLFVCGENWSDTNVAALGNLARFYGAPSLAARVDGVANVRAALQAAAALPGIAYALLLGHGTVGRTPGWRRALEDAARAHGQAACVSPTVLYEDESVRFAGCDGVTPLEHAPYVRLRRPLAGLPAGFAAPGRAVVTGGASTACCLIPRLVLDALPAPAPAALAWEPEFDLLLHLTAAECLWAPAVQVYAPDEPAPTDRPDRAQHLVARWCVRARLAKEQT